MKKEKISYSEAVAEVEAILARLQAEEMPIDELSEQVKRATSLIKLCRERLTQVEREVNESVATEPPGGE